MSLARRVVGATAMISAAGLFSRLFSFAAYPLLTRLVGPEGYGTFALASTITVIGSILSVMGMDSAYARHYLRADGEERLAMERFLWRVAIGNAILVGLAAAFTWLFIGEPRAARTGVLAALTGLTVGLSSIGLMGVARARIRGRYGAQAWGIAVPGAVSTCVGVAAAFALPGDPLPLFLAAVALSLLTVIMLPPPRPRELLGPALSVRPGLGVIRLGLVTLVTAPMYWIITAADRWILALVQGEAAVGVYGVAFNLATAGMMVNTALMSVWLPEATRVFETDRAGTGGSLGNMWTRMVGLLLVIWLAVTAAGGDLLRFVTTPAFAAGDGAIPWVAGGIFWLGLAGLGLISLMVKMDVRPAAVGWFIGMVANLLANLALIPPYGIVGAAVANCLGLAVVGIYLTVAAQRRLPLQIRWGRLALSGAICLFLGALTAPAWAGSPITSMLLKLPVGMAGALAVALLVAPDWLRYAWDLALRRQ